MASAHLEGAAIAVGVAAVFGIIAAFFVLQLQRRRVAANDPVVAAKGSAKSPGPPAEAWAYIDPEAGDGSEIKQNARRELCEALRSLLVEEIPRGLQRAGIVDRLDRLERQAAALSPNSQPLEPKALAMPPPPPVSAFAPPPLPQDVVARHAAPSVDVAIATDPLPVDNPRRLVETRDQEVITIQSRDWGRRPLTFGPSARQARHTDPPERAATCMDEDSTLRASIATVRKQLLRRDTQTSELHRQLRALEQEHSKLTREARHAERQMQNLLADPSRGTALQAEELQRLRSRIDELSGSLADSKSREVQLGSHLQRHRAYLMQTERLGNSFGDAGGDPRDALKKHPAGEIFLVPPPPAMGMDDDEDFGDPCRSAWDIGSSHVNPYATDSWPAEPNVLAQRASQEPNLPSWDEGLQESAGSDSGESEEEGPPESASSIGPGSPASPSTKCPRLPLLFSPGGGACLLPAAADGSSEGQPPEPPDVHEMPSRQHTAQVNSARSV